MLVVFVAAALLAVVLGLVLGRVVRGHNAAGPVDGPGREWINVEDLTGPAITLAALLLAFMLVQAYSSFQHAEDEATAEADLVLAEHHASDFLNEPDRSTVRADLVCYARSVVEQEWPAMADGHAAAATSEWEDQLRADLAAASDNDLDRLSASGLVDLDVTRATSRRERLAEIQPAVPTALSWLIQLTALSVLVLLCVFTWHLRPLVRGILVGTVAALVLMVVVGVRELDTPVTGFVAVRPTEMRAALAELESTENGYGPGPAQLPCDDEGSRVGADATPGSA